MSQEARLRVAALVAAFEQIVGANPDPEMLELGEKYTEPDAVVDHSRFCIVLVTVNSSGSGGSIARPIGQAIMRPVLSGGCEEGAFADAVVAMHLAVENVREFAEFDNMRASRIGEWYGADRNRQVSAWALFYAVLGFAGGETTSYSEMLQRSLPTMRVEEYRTVWTEYDTRIQAAARTAYEMLFPASVFGEPPFTVGERIPRGEVAKLQKLANALITLVS